MLARTIHEARKRYDQDLSQLAAPPAYNPNKRASYVFACLARQLILEAKSHTFKDGDGMDFCHSVMGAAFGSFALLDKHWKRRLDPHHRGPDRDQQERRHQREYLRLQRRRPD